MGYIYFLKEKLKEPFTYFSLSENLIGFGLPLFILISLSKYYSNFTIFLSVVLFTLIYYLYSRHYQKKEINIYRYVLFLLAFISGVAFIETIWNINYIHTLKIMPDAIYGYIPMSKMGISSEFFLYGSKPFVTPLIFKIFNRNLSQINLFFVLSYLIVSFMLIFSVSLFFDRIKEKMLIYYLLLLFFLNQSMMTIWLTIAHPEIVSVILTILIITIYAYFYKKKEVFNNSKIAYVSISIISVATFLFSFARDSNMYFIPFFLFFLFFVYKKRSHMIILSIVLISIFLFHNVTFKKSGRWKFSLANVIFKRIIPDKSLRSLFQNKYHLPDDTIVGFAERKSAGKKFKNKEFLFLKGENNNWVSQYGLKSYKDFLRKNPHYIISTWIENWHYYNKGFWTSRINKIKNKKLNAFIFYFPGKIPFFTAFLIMILGIIFFRENPLILVLIIHSFVIGIISFHGDAMGVARHLQQAAMTLRLSYLISIVLIYKLIYSYFSNSKTENNTVLQT